jgi:hypothetical protein
LIAFSRSGIAFQLSSGVFLIESFAWLVAVADL